MTEARKWELGSLSSHSFALFGSLFLSTQTRHEDRPGQKRGRRRAETDKNRRIDTMLDDYVGYYRILEEYKVFGDASDDGMNSDLRLS